MSDLIEDVHSNDKAEQSELIGYTYILVRQNSPHLIKVGYTSVSAEARASDYTDGEWKVHKRYPMPIWMARQTEKAAHKRLEQYWLDPRVTGGTASEVFICPFEIAEQAIELAYKDQLEKVLTFLKVPRYVIDYVYQQHGLIQSSQLGDLIEEKNQLQSELDRIQFESSYKVKELEHRLNKNSDELIAQKEKNNVLLKRLDSIEAVYPSDLHHNVYELETFSDGHIKPSQFEKLRDNYRKSIDVIRILLRRRSGNPPAKP
jgi:hypothetical protein